MPSTFDARIDFQLCLECNDRVSTAQFRAAKRQPRSRSLGERVLDGYQETCHDNECKRAPEAAPFCTAVAEAARRSHSAPGAVTAKPAAITCQKAFSHCHPLSAISILVRVHACPVF